METPVEKFFRTEQNPAVSPASEPARKPTKTRNRLRPRFSSKTPFFTRIKNSPMTEEKGGKSA